MLLRGTRWVRSSSPCERWDRKWGSGRKDTTLCLLLHRGTLRCHPGNLSPFSSHFSLLSKDRGSQGDAEREGSIQHLLLWLWNQQS